MKILLPFLLLLSLSFSSTASEGTHEASAIFAGGCFWCMEPPYDKLPGVKSTISGYSGGHKKNPHYKEVSSGSTGHYEVLQVSYDPGQVSYQQLLEVFWRNIDPLDATGQFCDKGQQYQSAIFYSDENERLLAQQSIAEITEKLGKPIATKLLPAADFYPAEDYHQDYYLKNPRRYKFYRWNCGRDQRLQELWGSSDH